MTAYLIVYGLDPTDRLAAYAFPTREEARIASRKLVPSVPVDGYGRYDPTRETRPRVGGCAYVIEREEDAAFSGSRLVEIYNGLTGESVSRFESRSTGIKRLLSKLPAVTAGTAQPQEESMSDNVSTQTTTPDAPPPVDTGSRGRRPKYNDDAVFALTNGNPWRDGKNNYARLSAALNATTEPRTIKAVVAAGLTRGDIAYLVEHNHATVTEE